MSKIAAVCVNIGAKVQKEIYYYYVPPDMENILQVGCRVLVPFGAQVCEGFIVEFIAEEPKENLKNIKEIIDEEPLISQEMVELARWVSAYYLSPLHKVLDYILPPYARIKKEKWVKLENNKDKDEIINILSKLDPLVSSLVSELEKGPERLDMITQNYGSKSLQTLEDLQTRGLVTLYWRFAPLGKKKTTTIYRAVPLNGNLPEDALNRAPKQKAIYSYLLKNGPQTKAQLCHLFNTDPSTLNSLVKKGLVQPAAVEEKRLPQTSPEFANTTVLTLNHYQEKAVQIIAEKMGSGSSEVFLIHGVTGSGKTEVYLASIKTAIKKGKGVIMLVPEIALTPQIVGRFKSVLGDKVVVMHSNLSQGERLDVWESLRTGQAQVIIGVRSAIFAPVRNLGLIIIDEEHENTYKQSEPDPRYHARDVALKRIQLVNGILILGSATPSLESFYRAQTGQYTLIEMPQRATPQPLPQVKVVDMREEFKTGNRSIFSRELTAAITQTLNKKEQVILFLNRRGFSTFVLCRECGTPLKCQYCSIPLTYHAMPGEMRCHYCNYKILVPKRCPSCGSAFIRYFGTGTEQVVHEIRRFWPEAKVARMDVDTTGTKNAHQNLLGAFKKGETDILVGTQMITKGLDFPNVTLVGVIAADTSLNLPDYNSGERTFQLLTQVAGRAGRGEKEGRVIVQTYNPDHYSIIAGKNQDFREFYQQEIEVRRMMDYPPFSSLLRVLASDYQEQNIIVFLEELSQIIKNKYTQGVDILGPAQAPIAKIKNRYRWQMILKGKNLNLLREAFRFGLQRLNIKYINNTLRVIIDVEPQSIL
ncbi:MAG: primosomal protein N' [Clostridia bacterium]|nr:primosomal protein N' [Clostridia bacterium]